MAEELEVSRQVGRYELLREIGRGGMATVHLARQIDLERGGSVLTQTGMTVGTPMYMSPEQAMGQDLGPGSDLYSVGCLAFELLAGRVPFEGEAPMAILLRHIGEAPPRLVDVWPDAGPDLSDWVARLLVKERAQRTASAADAWTELEELMLAALGPRWRREAPLP